MAIDYSIVLDVTLASPASAFTARLLAATVPEPRIAFLLLLGVLATLRSGHASGRA